MVNLKGKNDILNTTEVCKLLRVSRHNLWRGLSDKREAGKIYGKRVGHVWRIQRKEIYRYLNGIENKYIEEKIENDILNTKEVCKLLRITLPTLGKILSDKREAGKIYGRKFRQIWEIRRKEIYRYLNGIENKYIEEKIENDILNFSEVCKLLRISQPALDRILSNKRKAGKIYGRKFGREWRIQSKEIYRYLNKEDNSIRK